LIEEASVLETQMRDCEEAENKYGPTQRKAMAEIQSGSDALVAHGCNTGSCSQTLANECKEIGRNTKMRENCDIYNKMADNIAAACKSPATKMNCNTYGEN